jgi:hypothetical protein
MFLRSTPRQWYTEWFGSAFIRSSVYCDIREVKMQMHNFAETSVLRYRHVKLDVARAEILPVEGYLVSVTVLVSVDSIIISCVLWLRVLREFTLIGKYRKYVWFEVMCTPVGFWYWRRLVLCNINYTDAVHADEREFSAAERFYVESILQPVNIWNARYRSVHLYRVYH